MPSDEWNAGPAAADWSVGSNWTTGSAPLSDQSAVITNGSVLISGNATANSLQLTNTALRINQSGSLDVAFAISGATSAGGGWNWFDMKGGNVTAQSISTNGTIEVRGYGNFTATNSVSQGVRFIADGGLLKVTGQFGSPNNGAYFSILDNSTLEVNGVSDANVNFNGNSSILKLDNPNSFTGAIWGLTQTDRIDLGGVSVSSVNYSGNTLTVNETNGQHLTYFVASSTTTNSVAAVSDGNGGTYLVFNMPTPSWNAGPAAADWSVGSNWTTGSAPLSDQSAVITNGSVLISGNATANSLQLTNTALRINQSGSLDVAFAISGATSAGGGWNWFDMKGGNVTAQSISTNGTIEVRGYGNFTVANPLSNGVRFTADGGVLKITSQLVSPSYSTWLGILDNSTLELNGACDASVNFNGTGAVLKLDNPSSFNGTIFGLTKEDKIDLVGVSVSSVNYSGNTLTVNETNGQHLTYFIASDLISGLRPVTESDGSGGIYVSWISGGIPIAPTIIDSSIKNGYVNATNNTVTQALTGTAEAYSTVQIYLNGSSVAAYTATADGGGLWSVTIGSLSDGAYSYKAIATDSAGKNSPLSAALIFTVDTHSPSAPTIADSSIVNGKVDDLNNTVTQALTGTTEASSTVKIYLNNSPTAAYTTIADSSGEWSQTVGTLADGAYSYQASATDIAGNVSALSSALTFIVNGLDFSPRSNPIPSNAPSSEGSIVATGLDASGNAFGYHVDKDNHTYGFLVSNGSFQTVNIPNSILTKVTATTASNIFGFYSDSTGLSHGFVQNPSQASITDNPLGTYGTWLTTGNATTVAGTYCNSAGKCLGYIEQNPTSASPQFTTIDDPQGTQATWVIGLSTDSSKLTGFNIHADGTYHGFIYQGGNFTHLDVAGALNTIAIGVNSSGQVVGEYMDSKSVWHGFIYSNGNFTPFNYDNASLTAFTGINDSGNIVGIATVGTSTQSFATHIVG